MSYVTWDYECAACQNKTTELVDREDVPDHIACPVCGGRSHKIYGAVVANTDKSSKSRLDGHVPQITKDLKRAYRLESQASSMDKGSEDYRHTVAESKLLQRTKK